MPMVAIAARLKVVGSGRNQEVVSIPLDGVATIDGLTSRTIQWRGEGIKQCGSEGGREGGREEEKEGGREGGEEGRKERRKEGGREGEASYMCTEITYDSKSNTH